jgi:hypothetical protein
MLPSGGSYVGLVSPGGCGGSSSSSSSNAANVVDYTVVVQTLAWSMSKCFKDTHAQYDVADVANISFVLDAALLATLASGRSGDGAAAATTIPLYARRTVLRADSVVLPARSIPKGRMTNTYFEAVPIAPLATSGAEAGRIDLTVRVNEIWTISTIKGAGSRGDDTPGPNLGLAPIAKPVLWHDKFSVPACFPLTGHTIDSPLVLAVAAMDQQGVWESRTTTTTCATSEASPTTTMQQVIPVPPDEWHDHGGLKYPFTFLGPAVNLTGPPAFMSCDVMPSASPGGFAGIGFGRPTSKTAPSQMSLKVFSNGTWSYGGKSGVLPKRTRGEEGAAPSKWYSLSVNITHSSSLSSMKPPSSSLTFIAMIDGVVVASGVPNPYPSATTSFATFTSSYSFGSNSEFKNLCLGVTEADTPSSSPAPTPGPGPTPPGPVPPSPAPAASGVLYMDNKCSANKEPEARDLWTFSGEDKGEAGTFIPSVNSSLCLDLDAPYIAGNLAMVVCNMDPSSAPYKSQRWYYDASDAPSHSFSSVETRPCFKKEHGTQCHMCLDVKATGGVDLFDCKTQDGNQIWDFDVAAGEGVALLTQNKRCLAATP